mgnify:CR=1 FL=1
MDSRKVRIKYLYELPEYLHAYIKSFAGKVGIITEIIIDAEKTIYQIDLGGGVIIQAEKQFFIFINEEENKNMAALTGYAAVAVIEQGCYNKEYYYAIYADGYNYKVGDKVLVSNNNDIWTIKRLLTVQQAAEEHKAAITAEVVTHVDNSAYLERVKQRKEAADIKKDMDKIIKQMDEKMKYEIYAEENPELKKMLERYRELKGEWD